MKMPFRICCGGGIEGSLRLEGLLCMRQTLNDPACHIPRPFRTERIYKHRVMEPGGRWRTTPTTPVSRLAAGIHGRLAGPPSESRGDRMRRLAA